MINTADQTNNMQAIFIYIKIKLPEIFEEENTRPKELAQ